MDPLCCLGLRWSSMIDCLCGEGCSLGVLTSVTSCTRDCATCRHWDGTDCNCNRSLRRHLPAWKGVDSGSLFQLEVYFGGPFFFPANQCLSPQGCSRLPRLLRPRICCRLDSARAWEVPRPGQTKELSLEAPEPHGHPAGTPHGTCPTAVAQ